MSAYRLGVLCLKIYEAGGEGAAETVNKYYDTLTLVLERVLSTVVRSKSAPPT